MKFVDITAIYREDASPWEYVQALAWLVQTGRIHVMPGWDGRNAQWYIDSGIIGPNGLLVDEEEFYEIVEQDMGFTLEVQ